MPQGTTGVQLPLVLCRAAFADNYGTAGRYHILFTKLSSFFFYMLMGYLRRRGQCQVRFMTSASS